MSDLIDRQAVAEAIENTNWYHINGELVSGANSQEHEPLYRASDIYAALEEVPSVDAPQWIPCSERLPELLYGTYAVTVIDDGEYIETAARYCEGKWWDDGFFEHENKDVIAWMPLPEPYREEHK